MALRKMVHKCGAHPVSKGCSGPINHPPLLTSASIDLGNSTICSQRTLHLELWTKNENMSQFKSQMLSNQKVPFTISKFCAMLNFILGKLDVIGIRRCDCVRKDLLPKFFGIMLRKSLGPVELQAGILML